MPTKRTLWVFLAVVAVILAAATAVGLVSRGDDVREGWSNDGPVRISAEHGYVVRYAPGEIFTDGFERVHVEGSDPGVLQDVELVGPGADQLEVVGVLLAGPDRRVGTFQVSSGFPPTHRHVKGLGELVEGEGAPLAVGEIGSVLQIGIKVLDPGLVIRTGVRIYYTVNGEKFTALLPGSIAVCPDDMTDRACEAEYMEAAGWG